VSLGEWFAKFPIQSQADDCLDLENECITILRNLGIHKLKETLSHFRRLESSSMCTADLLIIGITHSDVHM
jgi:hypothetical protein